MEPAGPASEHRRTGIPDRPDRGRARGRVGQPLGSTTRALAAAVLGHGSTSRLRSIAGEGSVSQTFREPANRNRVADRPRGDDGARDARWWCRSSTSAPFAGLVADAQPDQTVEVCIREEHRHLVAVVALVAGSGHLAEDAVQEAWARAWERIERGDPIDHLTGWVVTVALNLARTGRRRQATERRALDRLRPRERSIDLAASGNRTERRRRTSPAVAAPSPPRGGGPAPPHGSRRGDRRDAAGRLGEHGEDRARPGTGKPRDLVGRPVWRRP